MVGGGIFGSRVKWHVVDGGLVSCGWVVGEVVVGVVEEFAFGYFLGW